jgi:hypothetical protein
VPGAIPADERAAHFELSGRLFGAAARERLELTNGYVYRFDVARFDDVARFVTNERRCCPFLDFTIELRGADDAVWLRLTGPDGTHAFLDAELPEWRDRGQQRRASVPRSASTGSS